MEVLFIFIVGSVISYAILYFVVKAAVRDAIVEARNIKDEDDNSKKEERSVSQMVCPRCGKEYGVDSLQCPHCGHGLMSY